MKKTALIFLSTLIFLSCSQKIDPKSIDKINGYWEITKAITADGKSVDYKVNETIDYFQIKNNQGFRKKVMPQFNGKYLTNNQSESIKIMEIEDKTYIQFKTDYGTWKEQIIEILDVKLILKNEQGIEYYYKRPTPFSVK